jgi:hypothetical protein
VHASPASPSVDFFAIATTNPPSTPTAGKASLTALVLQASGTVALDADAAGTTTYDLYFTTAGTVTSVASVSGVAVAAGKAYSVFLADQIGGGQPARIVHPD